MRTVSLTPPTPPTGAYDDPDSGWSEYEHQLLLHDLALERERILATAVQMALRQDDGELALALMDSVMAELRPAPDMPGYVMVIQASMESYRVLKRANQLQGDGDYPSPSST